MPGNNQVSPWSFTNLALYLDGCKQPLPFHVQPNYLPEFLFKSREGEKKKGFLPLPPLHGVNYCIFIWKGGKKYTLSRNSTQNHGWRVVSAWCLLAVGNFFYFKVSRSAVVLVTK